MNNLIFQNYHKHSHYTNPKISDSSVTNEEYAKRAVELNHNIISSCEHGWQGRYIECYNLAKKYNLKFLFSTEAYWVKDRTTKDRNNCHIFIAAKNENGRQAINDILSEANITGFYGQARIDIPLILSLPKNDVWVTSACIAGWKYDDIEDIVKQFHDYFGENYYLEVQYHNTEAQENLNKRIIKLHNQFKIPIIMGCDSHYIYENQSYDRTDFLISKGLTYSDEEEWFLDYPDGETAYKRFADQCVLSDSEIKEAIANTNIFLDVKEYDSPIFNKEIKMPTLYPDFTQEQKDNEYKKLVINGWNKYKKNIASSEYNYYESEIRKEIKTVVDTKMADYFIDNHYIIKKGKENGGNLTKTGRGSAVSFITNMLLGFTEVDRISASVKMYPERFMSTTRILQSGSLPDIDFNVSPVEPFAKAQKEVLGEDHAYPMIAYGTMQKSAAWKLYAKSQGIPFEIANIVSEQIKKYEIALKHADEDDKNNIDVLDFIDKQYHEIYEHSKNYLGLVTSWSIAPCSYLLYQGSIRKEIGLVKIKNHLCCLMDGHWAEENHFLKNDILKVSVVDLIYKSFHRIGIEPPSVNELLKMCPPDDPAWDIYKKSCTLGINQCEQVGTSARVAIYKPNNISELCAFVAAIRPGFKSMYKIFESRKPFKYGIISFDNLIQTKEMPSSFVLYQEQVMAALNYAGIEIDECYTAIKNIAKKRKEKVLAYKTQFVDGFNKSIIRDEHKNEDEANELTQKLWQIIEDNSRYSFNASHAFCVALDSLYGAWLKAHHPCEFYENLLQIQEEKGDKDKMNAIRDEAQDYFKIKFPPFKFRQDNRNIISDVDNNIITNSLASIKGFGSQIAIDLYLFKDKKYNNFIELLIDFKYISINSKQIETLIKVDYFSEFGNSIELLKIKNVFDLLKQGEAKQISKDKINEKFINIIEPYVDGNKKDGKPAKSYKILKIYDLLIAMEQYIKSLHIPDFDYKNKMQNQLDLLGYIDLTTNKEEDRTNLLITDVRPLKGQYSKDYWAYALFTKSIGTGKTGRLTVKSKLYNALPVDKFDIIHINKYDIKKNKKGFWDLFHYQKVYNN